MQVTGHQNISYIGEVVDSISETLTQPTYAIFFLSKADQLALMVH